ncbi:anaphase-promoting complex subunit 11 [Hyalella azteca]|uniref:Anaphase-promoting complex subunit 11 n=1 Tax=Hyalella azteca TaxID=294128 RepID=A0A8B7PHN9_HYAAZ|nr:anaphase-promoting complex subunit 11 [Hyalella azteca]
MKVKIKKWTGVGTWSYKVDYDNCGICRQPFHGCCPYCKWPGETCPVVWGQCTHCFHIHCMAKWLKAQEPREQCPLCRQKWRYA